MLFECAICYLDGKEITHTVEQHQRERGASIMGNEVYSY